MSSVHSIIVVDDELELASLFKAFLISEGYSAISFTDPVMALEYFAKTADLHSLIITDLRMPGLCGIDLAKRIRQINKTIKIFLMTAFDIQDLQNNKDFQIANIDKLLQKPIRFSELRILMEQTVKH